MLCYQTGYEYEYKCILSCNTSTWVAGKPFSTRHTESIAREKWGK